MIILFFVVIIINFFTFSQAVQNVECGSTTTVSNGDFAFLRSTAFPKNYKINCQAGFQTDSGNYLWLAMYNGATGAVGFDQNTYEHAAIPSYNSNYDVLTVSQTSNFSYFQLSQNNNLNWTAFEAVVLSYNPISFCPFAQKNITLSANMVIPIASDFGSQKIHATCGWTFITEPNQKLKVTIKQLRMATGFSFTLTTDGNPIDSFNTPVTADNPQIHYYDSTSGIFQFTMNNANSSNSNFLAFISAVNNTAVSNNKECKSETNSSNYLTVTNLDYVNGYNAFDSCKYTMSIPASKELLLHVDTSFIERNADTLDIYSGSSKIVLNNASYYHLTSNYNGSIIQFSSDGNTQQAGFSLHYNTIDCKCANTTFVAPCSGGTLFPTPNAPFFCRNMNCNYTIVKDSTCPNNTFFTLKLNLKMRDNLDNINVYLNGNFNEKLTSKNYNRKAYSFNSHPLLQFSSSDYANVTTDFENSWSIDVNYGDAPNILLTHNLTTVNPTYTVWLDDMHKGDTIVVCAPTGNTLEMFLSSYTCNGNLSNYGLYDSQNFENFVLNLDSSNICSQNTQHLPSKTSTSGCFTLYNLYKTAPVNTTVLFRLKEVHSKNCAGGNNVVQILQNITSTFSMSSTTSGSCELTILSATSLEIFGIQINQLSSSPNTIFNLKSPINQKKVLDLNSSEILYYLPLNFYTPALSIMIPYGKMLSITATPFTDKTGYITVKSARAILASPSYYGFKKSFGNYLYNIQPIGYENYVVKQLNSQVYVYGYQYYDQNHYYYFKENDNVTLSNVFDQLFETQTDSPNDGFLIEYSVPNAPYPASSIPYFTTTASSYFTYPISPMATQWPTSGPISTIRSSNNLICLSDSGHVKCSYYDNYCVYLSGTYKGAYVSYQGCSLGFSQGTEICTENEFTQGTTEGNTYTLQCCDENNCNTGKSGNVGTGGYAEKNQFCAGIGFIVLFSNYFVIKFLCI
uniref:CUB domain-containing protein n=1 Tax=Panagrolaimus sp. PS1159 TaxID=55785 RepID=A0AC35G6A5_9BILA